jgi:sulfite reductase (ferredoxin)
MKYLVHDRGVAWFREELRDYFPHPIQGLRSEPAQRLVDYLGWHRQAPGKWFVGLPLLCGRIEGATKQGLRELVATYQLEVRLTPNQDLLLCNIGRDQRSSVKRALADLGFDTPEAPPPLARHAIACPALPTCGLAITESERILPSVLERLAALMSRLEIQRSVLVRMTGCPNGCARPYMAEIGLVGSGVGQYQLWLGGSPHLTRLARPYLERMPLDNLEAWKQGGGRRSFGDFVHRAGEDTVHSLLGGA